MDSPAHADVSLRSGSQQTRDWSSDLVLDHSIMCMRREATTNCAQMTICSQATSSWSLPLHNFKKKKRKEKQRKQNHTLSTHHLVPFTQPAQETLACMALAATETNTQFALLLFEKQKRE